MDEDRPTVSPPDAPDKEKMDQIRRRRLEKLQGQQSTTPDQGSSKGSGGSPARSTPGSPTTPNTSSTSHQITPPSPEVAKRPKMDSSNSSTSFGEAKSNPLRKTGAQQAHTGGSTAIRISPAAGAIKATTQKPPPSKEEEVGEFENRILENIFRFTLDENKQTDLSGHRLVFLKELKQEIEEEGEPLRLTVSRLETAIMEAASKIAHDKSVLDYLMPCWKRVLRAQRSLKSRTPERESVLKEARRLCMSNCIFAVTVPELFGREPNLVTDTLVPHFLRDPDDDYGVCIEFVTEAVSRFDEDDTVKPMLVKAFTGLSSQLSTMTMNDNYKPYIQAAKIFTLFKPLTTAIAEEPLFQMAQSAPGIERHTLLGPFFRISPLQSQVSKTYFTGPKTMDRGHVKQAQDALRLTLTGHQRDLFEIADRFIRAGDIAKTKILDWFAYVVNSNHKRKAMRVDKTQVSSDGFMMNITVVLDCLCEPFLDPQFSKISRVDINYLRRQPRVGIKDETKLNADQSTSDEFYNMELQGSSGLVSEMFFLTVAAHNYGSDSIVAKLKSLEKDIGYFQKTIEQMETERPKFINNPIQLAQFETSLRKYNEVLEDAMCLRFAIEGVLNDDLMQARSLSFIRFVIVFMLRTAAASDYTPGKVLALPLSAEEPEVFTNLPEYFLEIIISSFKFIFSTIPHIVISTQTDELIVLCITLLRNSEYIKNPSLKAGLVTLLFRGTWPAYHRQKGVLGDALTGEKFANDYLLHSLMKFYIEAEHTGAHNQFYDKFNIRYEIFHVIKCIWGNDIYKQRLTQESRINTNFFVRFVNLLLNDATYVLDEALSKFPKIHELQIALKNPEALTQAERDAKVEELSSAEQTAKSYMQLSNETIEMMKLFTSALTESFTMPEIVQRLADMMDYTLDILVGKRSTDLIVQSPEKYSFAPRTLLAEIVTIYMNLGQSTSFITAVARDGRSYKPQNFEAAHRILRQRALKSKEDLDAWEDLTARIAKVKELDDQAELDLGEIPEEFEDPLLATLMEDPVVLPMSKQIVDRSTIQSHLLSDPTDPFNRQPMSIEDVKPAEELKAKILAWKEERKALAKKVIEEKMDTTA